MHDCVIVGGGIVGMCCARELALAGLRIALFDQKVPGRQASAAAGGILSPLYPWRLPAVLEEQARQSQESYPALARQLHRESGVDPAWLRCGLLIPEPSEQVLARAWARRCGARLELLDAAGAASVQPGLGVSAESYLWLPEVARIDNRRLLRALRRALGRLGVTLREAEPVCALQRRRRRIEAVRTSLGSYACGSVVLAAGAWSGSLLGELPQVPHLRPVRGQMIACRDPKRRLQCILLEEGAYLVPHPGGLVVAGSTLEEVGFDFCVTASAGAELQAAATRLLPALAALRWRAHWSGLRPASGDELPLLGRAPGWDNVYLNTGHYRNGILLAPTSARLLAALMLHDREPPEAFCPARLSATGA